MVKHLLCRHQRSENTFTDQMTIPNVNKTRDLGIDPGVNGNDRNKSTTRSDREKSRVDAGFNGPGVLGRLVVQLVAATRLQC